VQRVTSPIALSVHGRRKEPGTGGGLRTLTPVNLTKRRWGQSRMLDASTGGIVGIAWSAELSH
jgi:hypothetical protein